MKSREGLRAQKNGVLTRQRQTELRQRRHIMRFQYKTSGVCARQIDFDLGEDGKALPESDQLLAQTVAGFLGKQMES